MTIDDVVKLIEACKTSGVSRLKWEKLEISLYPRDDYPQHIQPAAAMAVLPEIKDRVVEELREDEDLRELALQNLLISDPLAYEAEVRKANGEVGR